MNPSTDRIFLHRTWATLRTAWVFARQWSVRLLGIYLYAPLVVLLGMLMLENHFTFAQYVSTCHSLFSTVLPFVATIAGILFGWRFPGSVWYQHFLEQRVVQHRDHLARQEAIPQEILDLRRKLGMERRSSE